LDLGWAGLDVTIWKFHKCANDLNSLLWNGMLSAITNCGIHSKLNYYTRSNC